MKEAGHADWSTRNQLQITGQDSLLTKGLIRASLFAQYRMSILLCSFNPNFPKTISLCLFPKSSYPAVTVSLSGVVSPWDTLMLQGLVSPLVLLYHARQPFGAILGTRPLFNFLFPFCNEYSFKIFYWTLKPDPCHLQVSGNVSPLACPKLRDTFSRSSITDLPDARRFILLHADQKITSRRLSSASAS